MLLDLVQQSVGSRGHLEVSHEDLQLRVDLLVHIQASRTALADSGCHFDYFKLGNCHKQLALVTHHRFQCCVASLQALVSRSLLFGLRLGLVLVGLFGAIGQFLWPTFALEFCFESRIQSIHLTWALKSPTPVKVDLQ